MSWMSQDKIQAVGFKKVGKNVLISDKASIYNYANISLGDNVRIDDFCVISAGQNGIEIGNNVHIAVYCLLVGNDKITLSDFSGLSSRVSIYSSSDDYSGEFMTNPTVPKPYTKVTHADVFLGKHVIVGSGSVILPGLTIGEGVAVGALSLVTKDCENFGIYSGSPAKRIKKRSDKMLELEAEYLKI